MEFDTENRIETLIMTTNQALYNQIIIDHYHSPRHHGALENPNLTVRRSNESCGDRIHLTANIKDGIIVDIAQQGDGCILSQAYASLLTETVINKSVDYVLQINEIAFIALAHMQLGPQRALCALLPLRALKEGLQNYHAQPQ